MTLHPFRHGSFVSDINFGLQGALLEKVQGPPLNQNTGWIYPLKWFTYFAHFLIFIQAGTYFVSWFPKAIIQYFELLAGKVFSTDVPKNQMALKQHISFLNIFPKAGTWGLQTFPPLWSKRRCTIYCPDALLSWKSPISWESEHPGRMLPSDLLHPPARCTARLPGTLELPNSLLHTHKEVPLASRGQRDCLTQDTRIKLVGAGVGVYCNL